MSIDVLQEKIRKLKTPIVVDFAMCSQQIPPSFRDGKNALESYQDYCGALLEGLQDVVPAVRFSLGQFAMLSPEGVKSLGKLLRQAKELGYYVLLDSAEILTPWDAECVAQACFDEEAHLPCDGLILSPFIGSDAIKPFLPYCTEGKKAVLVATRTPNKSAAELQDLLTGSRHLYNAVADMVGRFDNSRMSRSGYSGVGALVAATSGDSIAELRGKYKSLFLLVDGWDYTGANAKNCSMAFDRLGHGAVLSVGPYITGAWNGEETDGSDYLEQAKLAVEGLKKKLARHVTVM